jgi:hypothetical protein
VLQETENLRSAVSRQSLACLYELFVSVLPTALKLASTHPVAAAQTMTACIDPLVARAASEKRFLKDAAISALAALVRAAPSEGVLRALLAHSSSRHLPVASAAAAGTKLCLAAWRRSNGDTFKNTFTPLESSTPVAAAPSPEDMPSALLIGLAGFLGGRSVDAKASAKAALRIATGTVGHLPLRQLMSSLLASGGLPGASRPQLAPLLAPPRESSSSATGGARTPLAGRKPWLASHIKAPISTPTVLVHVATARGVERTLAKVPPPNTPSMPMEAITASTHACATHTPLPCTPLALSGATSHACTPRELRALDANAVLPIATPAKQAFSSRRVTRRAFAEMGKVQ